MGEVSCVAEQPDLPEEVPTQIGRPDAQALIEEIRASFEKNGMMGGGHIETAWLLRRALDELEMLNPVPVLLVRKTTKYPSHPECMRCARTRHRDLAIKRRKRR
jgi:hypothetical protein